MNPEDNQNNQGDASATLNSALTPEMPTPEAATPSDSPAATEETPSLDQVAADLSNAAPEVTSTPNTEPTPEATTAPEATVTPEAPVTPGATAAPEVSADPGLAVTPEPNVVPDTTTPEPATALEPTPTLEPISTPEPNPTPEIAPSPEAAPVSETIPAADMSTPVDAAPVDLAPADDTPVDSTPLDNTPVETAPDMSTDFTAEGATSTASFVGDTPVASKTDSSSEDEEPLKPADPVPGSIGSALAYSDSTPDHSAPVVKPKKTPMFDFKGNAKLIIMIIAAVVLVAIVVIVLLFVLNGTSNKKAPTSSNSNTKPAVTQPVVSSLTCTLSGDGSKFVGFGDVVSGEENVIAMYSDDELTSLGINMTLNYDSEEAANTGKSAAEQSYNSKYVSLKLTADPFLSTYDATGNVVTVTHQADGEKITTENAKVMDLYVLRGEVVSDIETLKDTYESDGFTCVEK